MIGVVVLVVVLFVLWRWLRARAARKQAATALSDTLGLVQPYKGEKFSVRTDRWL